MARTFVLLAVAIAASAVELDVDVWSGFDWGDPGCGGGWSDGGSGGVWGGGGWSDGGWAGPGGGWGVFGYGRSGPGWSVRGLRAHDPRWGRWRGRDRDCERLRPEQLDKPTITARDPAHWETTANGDRVWIPDTVMTEPDDVVTRGARAREIDAPSREAPTQSDIDDAVEQRDREALQRRAARRARPALGGTSAGGAAAR